MTEPSVLAGKLGFNRPTVLFAVWLGIGVAITGIALIDVVNEGFEEAWLFLLSGLFVPWFILRDWFTHGGGEFVTRADDLTFLGLTVFVLMVMVWYSWNSSSYDQYWQER